MSGLRSDDIVDAINVVVGQYDNNNKIVHMVKDYDVDNVSSKVVRIVLSYIDYINRTVWKLY